MILWDATSLTQLHSRTVPSGIAVMSVAFSPDGTKLASGDVSCEVIIWDASASSLTQLHTGSLGSYNSVNSVAFSPDGTKLASGGWSGQVIIWDASASGSFFSTTPRELLDKGIYAQIAIPLKGGAWRAASYALVAEALQRDHGISCHWY